MGAYKHLAVFVFLATFTIAVQGEIIIDHELLALTSKLQDHSSTSNLQDHSLTSKLQDHHLNYERNRERNY